MLAISEFSKIDVNVILLSWKVRIEWNGNNTINDNYYFDAKKKLNDYILTKSTQRPWQLKDTSAFSSNLIIILLVDANIIFLSWNSFYRMKY